MLSTRRCPCSPSLPPASSSTPRSRRTHTAHQALGMSPLSPPHCGAPRAMPCPAGEPSRICTTLCTSTAPAASCPGLISAPRRPRGSPAPSCQCLVHAQTPQAGAGHFGGDASPQLEYFRAASQGSSLTSPVHSVGVMMQTGDKYFGLYLAGASCRLAGARPRCSPGDAECPEIA